MCQLAEVAREKFHQGEGEMSIQGHSVQFYQDDTFLTDAVARFITEGQKANETVIVVATAQHREELHKVLTSRETTYDKLRFLDAREQLSTFMVDDWPNERRFKNLFGGMIGQASTHGPVRVFGEMVAILWAEGHPRAALRLEELWNRLMEEQSFALLCAYPRAKLSRENDTDSVLAISRLHTHVHTQSA
jgi:hypothetical protein